MARDDPASTDNAEAALSDSEERVRLALAVGELGTWDWNLVTGEVVWSDEHYRMEGYSVGEITPSFEAWISRVHPDDRKPAFLVLTRARDEQSTYRHEFRTVHPDGSVHWLFATGRFFYSSQRVPLRMIGVMRDVTERKNRERNLAFLAEIGRDLAEASSIPITMTLLARKMCMHLTAAQCTFLNVDPEKEEATRVEQWRRDGIAHIDSPELYPLRELVPVELRTAAHAGQTLAVNDTTLDPGTRPEFFSAIGVRSFIAASLVDRGKWSAILSVCDEVPRRWREDEIRLLDEVANRAWRVFGQLASTSALRESEERFRQFADASSSVLWIRRAETLELEYVSPSFEPVYGLSRSTVEDGPEAWMRLILPADREAARENLEAVRRGESVRHEFRIGPAGGRGVRWIRNHDFPLRDHRGAISRVAGIATDVSAEKRSSEHQAVLLAELQHRVRNILAVTRAIAARTADTAESVPDYAHLLAGRMAALARTQSSLTRAAGAGVDLGTLIRDEIGAHSIPATQVNVDGPPIVLGAKAAELMALALHELATNALKYGALADAAGSLAVSWVEFDENGAGWLRLDWKETSLRAPPERPMRKGFGTELITEQVPYELAGRGCLEFYPEGARCCLEFPLKEIDSILQTVVRAPPQAS
jgi:PAS domain S-box-containing protein